jgi:acetyl-CoA C-acetyltransferase
MREAVICEPVRTAVGRYGGALRDVPPAELAATVLRELVERTGLTSADIDDVLLGQCYPNSDAPAIGRVAALDAGLDVAVPGMQLDRRCGSGLQAVLNAAMQVQTGVSGASGSRWRARAPSSPRSTWRRSGVGRTSGCSRTFAR